MNALRRRLIGVLMVAFASPFLMAACDDVLGLPPSARAFPAPPTATRPSAEPDVPELCADAERGRSCDEAALQDRECETKVFANGFCNTWLVCTSEWTRSETPVSCAPADACPSSYAEVSDRCSGPDANTLICEYPEGTCGCAIDLDGGAADGADAGDAGASLTWKCVPTKAGCPRLRPAIGQNCVRPMTCDYGDCLFPYGATMVCDGIGWLLEKRCKAPEATSPPLTVADSGM